MSKRTNTKNFFKEFYHLRLELYKDRAREKYGDDVHRFWVLLDKYMHTYKWVYRDIEKEIFDEYNNHSDAELASILGISLNNYRVILNRVTMRLNSQLFYGDTISEVIKYEDSTKEAIDNLLVLLNNIEFRQEFSKSFLKEHNTQGIEPQTLDFESQKIATLLLVLNSLGVSEHIQSLVDHEQLTQMMATINDTGWCKTYNSLKKHILKTTSIPELLFTLDKYRGVSKQANIDTTHTENNHKDTDIGNTDVTNV